MTNPPSILVIDDEPNNFDVIQALLSHENYVFHYASSGQRAIDRLDRFQPDAILLDVMMPDLDGIEVCRQIKTLPEWRSIPIGSPSRRVISNAYLNDWSSAEII